MLEPCDAKVSRTLLGGLGDRKVAWVLGRNAKGIIWRKRSGYSNTSLSLALPMWALPRMQHQDHPNHGLASPLLRPPC